MSPIVLMPAATSRSSARGPTPGRRRIGNGARNAASRPGRTTVSPPGLRRSEATFGDDLRRRDAERARQPRPCAHDGLDRLGEGARVVEGRRDLAEVEVALVDPGLLDRRHDLADRRPHLARVVAIQRVAGAHEDGVRAAAQGLGARHRRVDAEAARDVVGGRDDAPPVRVAADDERHRRSAGSSSSSTAAKKASRSRCATITDSRVWTRAVAGLARSDRAGGRSPAAARPARRLRRSRADSTPKLDRPVKHCAAGALPPLGSTRAGVCGLRAARRGRPAAARRAGCWRGSARGTSITTRPSSASSGWWSAVTASRAGTGCSCRSSRTAASATSGPRARARDGLDTDPGRPLRAAPDALPGREADAHGDRRGRLAGDADADRPLLRQPAARADRPGGPFGPGAVGISAFSNVLTGWTQGGPIAIHGTNEPWSIGHAVSNGCIRLPNATLLQGLRAARSPVHPVIISP